MEKRDKARRDGQNQTHDKEKKKICGAKTRTGAPCQKMPMKNGRCRLHGGKATGPKNQRGNKNAVKHGAYETIFLDSLSDEEMALFYGMSTDSTDQLDFAIRLMSVRERRVLQRIKEAQEEDYRTVSIEEKDGTERGERTKMKTVKKERTTEAVNRMEEALTRIQDKKTRLIEAKHKIEQNPAEAKELNVDKLRLDVEKGKLEVNRLKGTGDDEAHDTVKNYIDAMRGDVSRLFEEERATDE